MTIQPFELDWLGGAAERSFRRVRPGIDDLPWGSLDPGLYPEELLDAARASWTEGAFLEYRTAAAMAALLRALLEVGAPIDLVGMAGAFVADEMVHTELNARVAMELGGAVPRWVDFERLVPEPAADLPAKLRALELAVRVSCVGEAFSAPMLASSAHAASHPLTRAVLARIAKDEAPHGRLGWLVLEWAKDDLGSAERAHLGAVAEEAALASLKPTLQLDGGAAVEHGSVDDLHQLGWIEPARYRDLAARAMADDVIAPLARYGIEVRASRLSTSETLVPPKPNEFDTA